MSSTVIALPSRSGTGAALLWPKGHSAVALTAKGIQTLAAAAQTATTDA